MRRNTAAAWLAAFALGPGTSAARAQQTETISLATAGLSLLPYLPDILRSQDWWILEKTGFQPNELWQKASQAIGFPFPWFNFVWVGLIVLGLLPGCALLLPRFRRASPAAAWELIAFSSLSLFFGLISFIFFLKLASLPTQPWYYLSLMGFVAVSLDAIFSQVRQARALVLVSAILLTAVSHQAAMPMVEKRQTNVALLAAFIASEARPDDLIIVNNWYVGVTFQRYYHGSTPWLTLPPLSDHSVHRYDLMKEEMQKAAPIQPVLEKAETALRSGNRVWLLGRIPLDGEAPPVLQPAPNNPWGWLDFPYTQIWAAQLGQFLTQHATGAQPGQPMTDVNPIENVEMVAVGGWH